MNHRAAILLLKDDKIALIERHRAGLHYFTFPGGHVDEGETPEQAAVREALEELGLDVKLKKLVAKMSWNGKWQHYFLAEVKGGRFGSGRGIEMTAPIPESGTFRPMWMPLSELLEHPVKPRELAEIVVRFSKEGWPEKPVIISE
jgi:8-oxo-dGTP diphosphatase